MQPIQGKGGSCNTEQKVKTHFKDLWPEMFHNNYKKKKKNPLGRDFYYNKE